LLYNQASNGIVLDWFDGTFHWGHPDRGRFRLHELRAELASQSFEDPARPRAFGSGFYRARRLDPAAGPR
jgi:hypothetical protein